MCGFKHAGALAFALGAAAPVAALDLQQPGVNLGATSIEDGGGGVGTLLQWSMSRFSAGHSYGADGSRSALPYHKELWVMRPHYAWNAKTLWLGGHPGWEVIVPVLGMDLQLGDLPRRQRTRISNPSLALNLQWLDMRLFGGRFDSRLALGMSLPLGDYQADADLNLGTDYVSFTPYYAFTWRGSEEWEISGRLMYLWNGRSHDPESRLAAAYGAAVNDVQVGQAGHFNLGASYALSPQWRLGIAGYWFNQLDADRINGVAQPDSRERIAGIGPAVQWKRRQHRLVGNLYVESMARNRSAGQQLVLRYLYVY